MNVKEVLHRPPPDLLFHYTTQAGLLGIIERKEIWASHTQYLNDVREFQLAITLVQEELHSMKSHRAEHRGLVNEMERGLAGIETINVCVCSLSADGDVLSQWRAYGGPASGFAVGFSGAFLRTVSDALGFWLVPVHYEEQEQRLLIRTLLEDVLSENLQRREERQSDGDGVPGQPPGGNLVAYLNRYAPILKHKSFSEEKEWRIISRPLPCTNDRFGYRASASMLIPYYRMPLSSEQHRSGSKRSSWDPRHILTSRSARLSDFSPRGSLQDVVVRNSQVPYRNW